MVLLLGFLQDKNPLLEPKAPAVNPACIDGIQPALFSSTYRDSP
jgi:hypothetical protein